jgi:hypothetical protein
LTADFADGADTSLDPRNPRDPQLSIEAWGDWYDLNVWQVEPDFFRRASVAPVKYAGGSEIYPV